MEEVSMYVNFFIYFRSIGSIINNSHWNKDKSVRIKIAHEKTITRHCV